jgi:hypothetical protein
MRIDEVRSSGITLVVSEASTEAQEEEFGRHVRGAAFSQQGEQEIEKLTLLAFRNWPI